MPIPIGILAVSGAGAAGSMELIQTVTLSSTVNSVTFSSIPQTYKHLELRVLATATSEAQFNINLNNVFSSSYGWHYLLGDGGSVTDGGLVNRSSMTLDTTSGGTVQFRAHIINLVDYASTVKNTTVMNLSGNRPNNGTGRISLSSGYFANTAAINRIQLIANVSAGFGFRANSRFSLYGIKG